MIKAISIINVIILHSHNVAESNPFHELIIGQAVPCFIMLSGYVYTMSEDLKNTKKLYNIRTMFRRFCRYTIPILITYVGWLIVRVIGKFYFDEKRLSFDIALQTFFLGKFGRGAYYYWILVGFLLVFPLIKWLIFKMDVQGLFLVGIANLFYCLAFEYYQLNEDIHDVLVFRYLLLIGMGVYLYKVKDKEISNEILLKMSVIGIVYLLLPICWNYEYKIFTYWSRTSMMAAFWVFPMMYIVLKNVGNMHFKNIFVGWIELIGRASYHIMCVQISFFNIEGKFFQYCGMGKSSANIKCVIAIVISVFGGIIFFYVDNKIFGRFYKDKKSHILNN